MLGQRGLLLSQVLTFHGRARPRLPGCTGLKDCMKLHLRHSTLRPFISRDVENSLLAQNVSLVRFIGKIPWSMNLPALTQRSGAFWFPRGGRGFGEGGVDYAWLLFCWKSVCFCLIKYARMFPCSARASPQQHALHISSWCWNAAFPGQLLTPHWAQPGPAIVPLWLEGRFVGWCNAVYAN